MRRPRAGGAFDISGLLWLLFDFDVLSEVVSHSAEGEGIGASLADMMRLNGREGEGFLGGKG